VDVNPFLLDVLDQPRALRSLADFYDSDPGVSLLSSTPAPTAPVLVGMGASFHAVRSTTPYLHTLGIPALTIESVDLLHYGIPLMDRHDLLLFVSQSGASAEVMPIVGCVPSHVSLWAMTNNADSPLARHSSQTFPLLAGAETVVATKTYVNSLATLWLLGRKWAGDADAGGIEVLRWAADEMERLLADADAIVGQWLDVLGEVDTLLFIGHGPQAATAGEAAMLISEWAKMPAMSASAGAVRHGLMEMVQPGCGIVVFAAPGRAYASSLSLAEEVAGYGARVLVVEGGRIRDVRSAALGESVVDEFLSPVLDVVPVQLFADAWARRLGIPMGFRHIQKVVTRL